MTSYDFARSFLMFRIDVEKRPPKTVTHQPPFRVNNARIQLDCRALIRDKRSGNQQEIVLGANCKTERVGVDREIWTAPNADFVPILSNERFINLKTYDFLGRQVPLWPAGLGVQSDRQSGLNRETFDAWQIHLVPCEAVPLRTTDEIVEAVLANHPLNASTSFENDRYHVQLDYPVKTINASERDGIYQTDTGPVLFPDLTREPDDLLNGLDLAFSAFNSPAWIEFLVRVPCELASGISVYHYARSQRVVAHNALYKLPIHAARTPTQNA